MNMANEIDTLISVLLFVLYFQGQLYCGHMKGFYETDTPISVILCVPYFQGQLHCCIMKALNENDTSISVLQFCFTFLFLLSRATSLMTYERSR